MGVFKGKESHFISYFIQSFLIQQTYISHDTKTVYPYITSIKVNEYNYINLTFIYKKCKIILLS